MIRGARWAPGVTIYIDCRSTAEWFASGQRDIAVRHLDLNGGPWPTHDLAHLLSVQGRCRDAPDDGGAAIAKATKAVGVSKRQRQMGGVDILLAKAREEPPFDSNFVALAERLGWISGRQCNPAIAVAAKRWAEEQQPTTSSCSLAASSR